MTESIFLTFIPFIVLTILANLGNRSSVAEILTYLGLVLTNLLFLLGGAVFFVIPLLGGQQGGAPPEMVTAFGAVNWPAAGLTLAITGVVAFLPLLQPVRRGLAHLIPIDPGSTVHTTALVFTVYLIGGSIVTLWLISLISESQGAATLTPDVIWTQELIFALIGALGVGLLTRRGLRGVLERLNLGGLSPRSVMIAAGLLVLLLAFSWVVSYVWKLLDPGGYEHVGRISEVLFGNLTSPWAVLTLGLAAGIGEEILFRGALQPRLGLPLTAFLFMIAHTQYTISPALIELFVVGWVLGVVRQRTNTTVCILIHAVYNILNVVLAPLYP